MINNREDHKLWDADTPILDDEAWKKDCYTFESPRIFGKYRIHRHASVSLAAECTKLGSEARERLKARLATILIDRIDEGEEVPFIDPPLIEHVIENSRPLPVPKRARRLLEAMANSTRDLVVVDTVINVFMDTNLLEGSLGACESVSESELQYFLSYLTESELIKPSEGNGGGYLVTVKGHELIEQEIVSDNTSRVFVAMWFDREMENVWHTIKRAVESAGYEPVRVDLENFEGLIDDKIVSEIRTAKFIIADLTHGDAGHRGSVYYETGFARGLNKSVIQTVRKDHLDTNVPTRGVAFDTSHYPLIEWCENDLQKFEEDLLNRINSRFGTALKK